MTVVFVATVSALALTVAAVWGWLGIVSALLASCAIAAIVICVIAWAAFFAEEIEP